ncbi:hypothetical protein Nepgr_006820 [Nepenthes gracilis]|uniref:Uncharacterized protein n=1 Tax=Nepenthes gracilis TaxID=150966 RepID=A0AAD3XHT1_NEPGR|nr:hypothetical protein Nepgr_006820 [Nepenthes gracilis]
MLPWSLSEHQKKPTDLLTLGVESKTKENQAMSQQHPNSWATFADSYPVGIGFLSTDGRDSPLEDKEPLTQIVDDVLMCCSAQQENIKMERHPVSYADIMKHGILNAADATGSYEPLMPARPITVEDRLDAQGRPYDHDETVGPPAIGKAPRIGFPSHVAPNCHQGGELSWGTKFGQLRRNILALHKQFIAPRANGIEDSCDDRDIHYDGHRLKSILKKPKKPKKKCSPSAL